MNAYALAFGGLLLLGGRAGDLLGRRRIFVVGIAGVLAGLAARRARHRPGVAAGGPGRAGRRRRDRRAYRAVADRDDVPAGPARNRAMGVYAAMASPAPRPG